MAESDTRRWSLRSPGAETCSNNIPTATLVQWANLGTIKPGYALSADGETWVPAETLPELQMTWYVLAPGRAPYGPITKAAAEHFIAAGHFPAGSKISQDPGTQPVSIELPLPIEPPPQEDHAQELEETRKRLVLLEREVRQKDRRIDELRQEIAARQTELNIDGKPDVKSLTQELEALRLEHQHLQTTALEAKESAAERERTLHQRVATLEAALEAAQNAVVEQPPVTDATLFAVLSHEADILRQSQDEEERYLDQLRELSRQRLAQFSARLLELHQILGGSPEQMRVLNTPHTTLPPMPTLPRVESHAAELEQALAEARKREAELQRQLVAREGEEAHLRSQVGRAEQKTLEALKLDETLRDTVEALQRERRAREEEHRESAHIQEQLIRRIEELERIVAGMPPQPIDPEALPQRKSSFGWLRKH